MIKTAIRRHTKYFLFGSSRVSVLFLEISVNLYKEVLQMTTTGIDHPHPLPS